MTLSISMSDEEYKFISEYAAQKNMATSDFIISSVLKKYKEKTYTLEEVLNANDCDEALSVKI